MEQPDRTGSSSKKVVTTPSVQPDEEEEVEEIEFELVHRKRKTLHPG